ncbi:DNA polymerase III subunit delta [Marinobacter nanhaiticus D15-8W]|uniref:DNA polymerase III subunit delta n=1 Tax=Marinobacter nanhaiticus D15-8W TaxID=626887 RepID=N6WQK7_9GAMM|nr:DNA polymerase III subunit delta [Marinobacter nanhaiticus]ENO13332.1 DNA polymerase III subunit delta [Marinobacter nanhaiticus D15-8W]BES70700.1 DNA polymerase III subunit delta [Marinobacter nanhaiticus D15-8W]
MKTSPAQLDQVLSRGLAPVYLVSGDEPLLVQECCDKIRSKAREAGYEDRQIFHADRNLDWGQVGEELNALSLFAEKRRLEIHLPTGKLGDGRSIIEQALQTPPEDIILILISVKLDAAEIRRKWYKLLQEKGVHVPVWPIDADKFPGWLQQRARIHGLTLTQGALEELSDRLEGNLLAASQEIDRLALLAPNKTIDEQFVTQVVLDSARFSVFELVGDILTGSTEQAHRVIGALQQEEDNPLGLLAILSRDLRMVGRLQLALQRGETAKDFFRSQNIRQPQRMRQLEQAARRLHPTQIRQAMLRCSDMDRSAKGFDSLSPWHYLRTMATELAARR